MEYRLTKGLIEIKGKEDFNIRHILDCGQIFDYNENVVCSAGEIAVIKEIADGFKIFCSNERYFEIFFDLQTNYSKVKDSLKKYPLLKSPIEYGKGIRILKNDIFEVIISFIISANNNIKRIKLILSRLREKLGKKMTFINQKEEIKEEYYSFPSYEQLLSVDESFFTEIGCGYRAKYLHKVLRQIDIEEIYLWKNLPTEELRNKLIALSGVGPKVADCILLFGYGKKDVFPVDTWINQMYNQYYKPLNNRSLIRKNLVEEFGELSGYAQQYLFYYQREEVK